ncbi:MAG: sigma-54 dependent transcriptional regulator [Aliiglaciecola sp.]|uniref:sigma-54-dependent transcriptional regulator n=1 Tax=Aliiglaciecola sp. M165 TaxID=2593649 RepID=UPI00117C702A|nr:sigma-54 dependent transcriptional regulator [Aliiglaciecola sp. M165]TRY32944.1 sigma-54-dependent Fis family transcriptional regulator [Aliiglaciecola sp. M165]
MLEVLLVDDDEEFTNVACQIIEFLGHQVSIAANLKEATEWLQQQKFDHVFLDFMLPDGSGLHLIDYISKNDLTPFVTMITGHPAVKGMLAGLCGPKIDYIVKPLQREDLENALNRKPKSARKVSATSPKRYFGCLVGESEQMQELYTMIERVAKTSANVMLMGESGVGKEVVARAIHHATNSEEPIVATNCGALSKELIGSELFGHEKGAFTGAVARKQGVFEQAGNGTLFLDEVTEMPLDMQPNLLRVLESKRVVPVGGTREIAVNCRVVSATNRSVEELAEGNVLREDIYFRLAVFPIDIPALRERRSDIPLLAQAFLEELNNENASAFVFQPEQLEKLKQHDWPGNVRELRHAIHRAVIMSDPTQTTIELPKTFLSPFSSVSKKTNSLTAGQTIDDVERELIQITLAKVDGNKTLAAEMLGISTKTLYNRLHAYGEVFDS